MKCAYDELINMFLATHPDSKLDAYMSKVFRMTDEELNIEYERVFEPKER